MYTFKTDGLRITKTKRINGCCFLLPIMNTSQQRRNEKYKTQSSLSSSRSYNGILTKRMGNVEIPLCADHLATYKKNCDISDNIIRMRAKYKIIWRRVFHSGMKKLRETIWWIRSRNRQSECGGNGRSKQKSIN